MKSAAVRNRSRRRSKDNGARGWMDISVAIRSGMVRWPGDTPVQIERIKAIARGDDCNVSRISMGSHTGTHMDAPVHFLRNGRGLDQIPLDATVGPARVIQIRNPHQIAVEDLLPHRIQQGERLLLKTRNSIRCWKGNGFVKDFVALSIEAANFLVQAGIRTVGVDYLSVGPFKPEKEDTAVHRALLRAGIWIIEGLNLSAVKPGTHELVCLPIKILGGDGAPARAILKPLQSRSLSRSTPEIQSGSLKSNQARSRPKSNLIEVR